MDVGLKKAESQVCFEETELRLGLPGNGSGTSGDGEAARKRGFSETETASVDLMLNLSFKETSGGKDAAIDKAKCMAKDKMLLPADPARPPAKAQVVGWPPVRSFRKNILATQKNSSEESEKASGNANFVKVSMDGAPYLRKVDLQMYKNYRQLSDALGQMFSSFTTGNCGTQEMKDFMNESKLTDLLNSYDYVSTYEDKDGDWMLVGDVPWEMFAQSCKRLRIMKGTEAIGLAPRSMEKCKNRS